MEFPQNYFCAEVRDDFEIPAMMKRAWAAELEVLSVIADVCIAKRVVCHKSFLKSSSQTGLEK